MVPQPPPAFVVPGMKVGCLVFNALIASTLECFYDPICLNTTATWISTLSPAAWPKPLDRTRPSRFLPTSAMSSILSEQMVENWTTVTNFTSYYATCSPIECIFTISERSNIIYVITILLGSFGGLMVVLRIVSPLLIRLYHFFTEYFSKRNQRSTVPQDLQIGMYGK